MTQANQVQDELLELMCRMREGDLTALDRQRLGALLLQYPQLQDLYIWYMLIWLELRTYQSLSDRVRARFADGVLARQEDRSCPTGPDIKAIEQEAQRRLERFLAEQQFQRPSSTYPDRRLSIDMAYLATKAKGLFQTVYRCALVAAVCLVMAGVVLVGIQYVRLGPVVARVVDSMDARWSETLTQTQLRKGPVELQSGLAELVFSRGTRVWLEGPVRFDIRSGNRMALASGKVFADVPASAKGFQLDTPFSTVVDLGTQFGLEVRSGLHSDLYVFAGQASICGRGLSRARRLLDAGQAGRASMDGSIETIPFNKHGFVRRFFASTGTIWRGQPIDLADMIGGGNGFGSGGLGQWIDIATGMLGTSYIFNGKQVTLFRQTDRRYRPVVALAYVDGVFSPDGTEKVIVSSAEHIWQDCPRTSGIFFEDIYNGDYIIVDGYSHALVLAGIRYGTREQPGIAIHSNAGITFDLDAIRRDLPGLRITSFHAVCGISQDAARYASAVWPMKADFWVLLDGKVRFTAIGQQVDADPKEIMVDISDQDRFLTLACTDSDGVANHDWGLFAKPSLEVVEVK